MKLDVLNKDVNVHSSSDESLEYGIDTSQLQLLYQILSQYSNPVGSLIRELVTNAFDSHIEAGVNDRVTVRLIGGSSLTNSSTAFEVEDYGVGLSPERVKNVYSKFLASTKRDSNREHGAFGLGSKSPFSYTDMFFVTTRYNGTEYFYALHKGSKAPKIEKLDESPTDKGNGTVVNINIQTGDRGKFILETKRQLAYFDNVDYEGFASLSNDYKIYQGKNFIFRQHAEDLNLKSVHICLGKVYYPIDSSIIDFKKVTMGKHEYSRNVETPIGLKFEIGDIPIIWSRENIEYTDEAVKAIKEKYEAAQKELKTLYSDQQEEITTVKQYYAFQKSNKDNRLRVDEDVEIPNIHHVIELDSIIEKYKKLPNLPKFSNVVNLVYKHHKKVRNGRAESPKGSQFPRYSYSGDKDTPVSFTRDCYLVETSYSTLKNKYIHEQQLNNYFHLFRKRTGQDKADEKQILFTFGYEEEKFIDIPEDEVKLIKQYTVEVMKLFQEVVEDYEAIDVPEYFKKAKKGASKKGMFDPSSDEFDRSLKIHFKETYSQSVTTQYRTESGFNVWEPTIGDLLDNKRATRIYGFQEDSDLLEAIAIFLHRAIPRVWQFSSSDHKKLSVLKIAKSKEELLLEVSENAIPVKEFLSRRSKILVRELTYFYICNELEANNSRPLSEIKSSSSKYLLQELGMNNFIEALNPARRIVKTVENKYYPSLKGTANANIPKHIQQVFSNPAYLDQTIIDIYERARDFIDKYPLLYKLMITEKIEEEVVEELKFYLKGKNAIDPSLEKRLKEYKEKKNNTLTLEQVQSIKPTNNESEHHVKLHKVQGLSNTGTI